MARIRDYENIEKATGPLPEGQATPAGYGAGVGAALGGLSDSMSALVRARAAHEERSTQIEASLYAATVHQNATVAYFDAQKRAPEGAPNFTQEWAQKFDQVADDTAKGFSSAAVAAAKVKVANTKTTFFDNAAGFEATSGAKRIRDDADQSLRTIQNVVTLDPNSYEQMAASGSELIDKLAPGPDGRGLPVDLRDGMKRTFLAQITNDRFDALIKHASAPEQIDNILTEMADDKYAGRMNPTDTARLVNDARTQKHSIGTQATAEARAALTSIKGRMDDGANVDGAEIGSVDGLVKKSGNLGLMNEWEKAKATQKALRSARVLPKDVVDQATLDENGLPTKEGTPRYQNLPNELNDAIGTAVNLTGGQISGDFLARTMIRESGSDISKLRRGKSEYAPKPANGNVDVKGIKAQVYDAATVAGQIFGEPLVLNSGHRSQEKQDAIRAGRDTPLVAKHSNHTSGTAIDIDTGGWSGEKKAKLVDALVQSGFTGFGEYDGHVHADFRANVPGSFDAKSLFGGWTNISPEVAETLAKRGFKGGAASGALNRTGADGKPFAGNKMDFDFGSGNGPDGRPLSTARGPMQFIEGTWLEYLPQAAKAYGIDISGLSREQQLKLRGEPKVAASVYAYYSLQNKKVMEGILRRPVNESELYMGHLMGATGASNFLKAWQVNPNGYATDILSPAAIEANRSVFVNKDGSAKKVGQVYAEIATGFNNGIDTLGHERVQAYQKVQGEMKALNEPRGDAMTYAMKNGVVRPAELNTQEGFASRGEQALKLEQFYHLNYPKPLTSDEVSDYKKKIEDGTAEEAVEALRNIGGFGGRAAEGAARQIGDQSPLAAHLAGLYASGTVGTQVAEDVIRGNRLIKDNAAGAKDWLHGAGEGGTVRQFDAYVGNAFDNLDAKARAAAKEAADAYYVQKFASRGDGSFDPKKYQQAVDATLGNRLGVVNGTKTVLPPGVTSEQFDSAVDRLGEADLAALSATGERPLDSRGRAITANQVSIEGRFQHIGGDQYLVKLGDGKPAVVDVTGRNGFPLPYVMRFDAKTVARLAGRTEGQREHYWSGEEPGPQP